MEFSINIPYRKVTFKISIDQPKSQDARIELERSIRKHALAEEVSQEIRNYQDNYFLLKV